VGTEVNHDIADSLCGAAWTAHCASWSSDWSPASSGTGSAEHSAPARLTTHGQVFGDRGHLLGPRLRSNQRAWCGHPAPRTG